MREGGSFRLDRVWCILTVKESTSSFFVGFVQGGVRWRVKGMAWGGDTKATGERYDGQFSSAG